jgi:hypothetical protein
MRGGKRGQLLGPASELDHLVELDSPFAEMPRNAQSNARPVREAEAWGEPLRTEFKVPSNATETLLSYGKALA